MKPIKLLIVDDHQMIREGIKALLDTNTNIEIVGEAENGKLALDFIAHSNVEVVLMDVDMPVLDGIETSNIIKENYPGIKIVALSMHNDPQNITAMLQVGVNGYVLKTMCPEMLEEAIFKVHSGEDYFNHDIKDVLFQQFSKKTKKKPNNSRELTELTTREKEILRLIAEECTNPEIAEKLFISTRTVDTHRRNLLQKLGAKNTAGLVKYALKHDLV